jgi:hypothetical protein
MIANKEWFLHEYQSGLAVGGADRGCGACQFIGRRSEHQGRFGR